MKQLVLGPVLKVHAMALTAVDGSLEPPSEGTNLAVEAGLPRLPFNLSDNRCNQNSILLRYYWCNPYVV